MSKQIKVTEFNFTADGLGGNWSHLRNTQGKDIYGRTQLFYDLVQNQIQQGTWLNYKSTTTKPGPQTSGIDEGGKAFSGINFSSQDYLSLGDHPQIKKGAIASIEEYGVHSAGSPAAFGRTKYTNELAQKIANFLGFKHGILYSTGWLAGYGCISGLVRPYDYILVDRLAHNCLMEGCFIATRNVHFFEHLNNEAAADKIKAIRKKHPNAGILVVTEGLFSMDSDWPNLNELQRITKELECNLLIDIAHDFGCLGENGRGQLELQKIEDRSNVMIIGAGSKVLSTNLGYVCCDNIAVIEYLKIFSTAQMFTNSVIPVAGAIGLEALKIVSSEEGNQRRKKLMENILLMRSKLEQNGFTVYGQPSPIVPLVIGNEGVMRICARLLMDNGYIVNPVEFPAVPRGTARYRLQIMTAHTKEQIESFVEICTLCYQKAKEIVASLPQPVAKANDELQTQPKL